MRSLLCAAALLLAAAPLAASESALVIEADSLAARVLRQEHRVYPRALKQVCEGK